MAKYLSRSLKYAGPFFFRLGDESLQSVALVTATASAVLFGVRAIIGEDFSGFPSGLSALVFPLNK